MLRRRHFEESILPRLLSPDTSTELHFRNDIYTKVSHPFPGHIIADCWSTSAHSA